jgi:hypothetical protein
MTNKTNELTSTQKSKAKYEDEGRGKVLMRVQLSKSDNTEDWETAKKEITNKFGSAKEGIFALYMLAKNSGVFSSLTQKPEVVAYPKLLPMSKAPRDAENGILIFDENTNNWVVGYWRNKKEHDLGCPSCWTDKEMFKISCAGWLPLPTNPLIEE